MGDTYIPPQFGEGAQTTELPNAASLATQGKDAGMRARYSANDTVSKNKAAQTARNSAAYNGSAATANLDPLVSAEQSKILSSADAEAIRTHVDNDDMSAFKAWADSINNNYTTATKRNQVAEAKRFSRIAEYTKKYVEYKQNNNTDRGDMQLYKDKYNYISRGGGLITGLFNKSATEATSGYNNYVAETYNYNPDSDAQLSIATIIGEHDLSNANGITQAYNAVGRELANLYLTSVASTDEAQAKAAFDKFNAAYSHAITSLGYVGKAAAHNLITYCFYNTLLNSDVAPTDDKEYAHNMLSTVDYDSLVGAVNTVSDSRQKHILGSLSSLGGWLPKLHRR